MIHNGPWREIGLLEDGCKKMKCETCGNEADLHFKIYGCKNKKAG